MFNVKNTNTGDEELRNLESSISTYRIEKKERDIQKSIDKIIDCIETEMRKSPGLKNRVAIETEEVECLDWFDLLSMIKDTYS